ncbi:hypothetical protein H6801_01510 [Candidatus Nomurabacteria bacterium]|nr:hypothetical protein [Candidatus Saccharibacteria bacterium]MCA9313104.1 hypothetical protein [Candidatus Saccharibacteria bacterium]MCB9822026.1 hypothetical protein [Candidatus Nomurabacteria bacterium]
MKKFARILILTLVAFSILTTPTLVSAQDAGPIVIDTQEGDDIPSTGAAPESTPAPATPETGFAPTENKLLQNGIIFTIGGTLGAGIGLGIVALKKRQAQN